jgi:nitroreductase
VATYQCEVKAMIDWIKARRSIRKYTPQPVGEEQVRTLLEAAMAAPSGSNKRPWEFIVIRDAALKQQLSQLHRWSGMVADAPVVIAVCGRPSDSHHWIEDCSAATQNLLLAATALGLGSVWVAVYPRKQREDRVRELLRLPAEWHPLCLVPVGCPAESKPPRTQYDEEKVHREPL